MRARASERTAVLMLSALLVSAPLVAGVQSAQPAASASPPGGLEIHTISSRADLVSGGAVLATRGPPEGK